MKHIRNPVKWLVRRGKLINMRAKAIKHHKARRDIERELRFVTAALIAYANRRACP